MMRPVQQEIAVSLLLLCFLCTISRAQDFFSPNAESPQQFRMRQPNGLRQGDGRALPPLPAHRGPVRVAGPGVRATGVERRRPVLRRVSHQPTTDAEPSAESAPIAETPSTDDVTDLASQATQPGLPTKAVVEQQMTAAKASEDLTPEQLEEITKLLQQASKWLQAIEDQNARTQELRNEISAAEKRKRELQLSLETQSTPATPSAADAPLAAVEQAVQDAEADLNAVRHRRDKHQTLATEFREGRDHRAEKQRETEDRLDAVVKDLDSDTPPADNANHTQAWRTELRTRKRMLEGKLELLQVRADYRDVWMDLYPLRSDLDQRDIANAEANLKNLTELLAQRRRAESQRQAREARDEARLAEPALQDLAERNAQLAERRTEYADLINQVAGELEGIQNKLASQRDALSDIKRKAESAGFTETVGLLLRSQRTQLIDIRPLQVRSKEIAKLVPRVQLEILQRTEERTAMWNIADLTNEHMKLVNATVLERFTRDEAAAMVQDQLTTRRDYLDALLGDMALYRDKLGELEVASKKCIEVTQEHRSYIDEHVLWIRSAERLNMNDIEAARAGVTKLLDTSRWSAVVSGIGTLLRDNALAAFGTLAAFAVGLVLCDRLRDRIQTVGQTKEVQTGYRFYPTVEAVLGSTLVSWFLPTACYLAGWCLALSHHPSDLTPALAEGLQWLAMMWLPLAFLYQLCSEHGVGEAHFGWHTNNLKVLRRNLRWLMAIGLPIVFVVMVIESYQNGAWENSLGRIAFIAGMLVMAVFMHRLLDPYRGARGIWANPKVWMFRLRHALHTGGVLLPVVLSILSWIGYVYSAHQLAYRAQLTLWLVLAITICHALVTRYLTIVRKRTAMRHMQRRRSEQALKEQEGEEPVVDQQLDFQAIGAQLQRLLRGCVSVTLLVGAYLVWADMIPALKMLDRVPLWPTVQTITEHHTQPDGTIETVTGPRLVTITLADGLLAVFAVISTLVATRNLPGLLNITIFERLPIDFGTRYALTMVSRYLISLVGFIIALELVGITWSSVQWLVAAMTVGLGFGLQEIFANFVSGLIILTERPVRVGDMVTVGGITGKVTRMQIRATTLTDFDRRELVVPNKRFITEDVINWTLSDPITRVVCSVGIAYHCDPELARRKLMEVANGHPLVLKEPAPSAIFMGFGDSTLDLDLRVFIVGRDNLYEVRDELNLAINRAFREANLEIAFPQRDLHIRTVDGEVLAKTLERSKAA